MLKEKNTQSNKLNCIEIENMKEVYDEFIKECDMFIKRQKEYEKQKSKYEIEKEIIEDERKRDFISRTIK